MWRWAARNQFIAALALIGAIVAAAFFRDAHLDAEQDRRVACIGDWGNAVSDRTARLLDAVTARAEALDAMLRDVADQILSGRQDRASFHAKLLAYVAASDDYRRKLGENPVPQPPRILC